MSIIEDRLPYLGPVPVAEHIEALEAELERVTAALREINEPLCDDTFRARLLRQGLSTDEMRQYVEAVEALQRKAALAGAARAAQEDK
jgi:uncharacterized protein (UPF0335 family)